MQAMPRTPPPATPESVPESLPALVERVRGCTLCAQHLPLGPRPILRVDAAAELLIIGQAPGTKVHASGLPWDDASGDRLRQWLGVDREQFYDDPRIGIMPMGFCYPGRGRAGDLPPRPECAPQWHAAVRAHLPRLRLTLLIGRYAQAYYLGVGDQTLEATVQRHAEFRARGCFPLPHPSPRNTLWLKRRPWFETEVLPALRAALAGLR
jgi:uracil-DNA glycosylase